MHRNLFESSLQRGAKRNLPTISSQHFSRCRYHNPSQSYIRRNEFENRKNLGRIPFSHNNCYSTTRALRRPPDDKNNLPSTSSSSFLDRFKKQAASAFQSSKSAAEEATKNATAKATSAVRDTTKKMTETAQQAASKTLESTQKVALKAKDQAVKRVSETAAAATKEGSRRLSETAADMTKATGEAFSSTIGGAKQKLSEGASEFRNSTGETISKSTRAIGSGVEEKRRAATATAEGIAQSSKQLKDSVTMTGTKVLRWFWWWSLAAIFVYGVASTLPMAIIKYTMEDKKRKWETRQQSSPNEEVKDNERDAHGRPHQSEVDEQTSGKKEEPTIYAVGWETLLDSSNQSDSKKD